MRSRLSSPAMVTSKRGMGLSNFPMDRPADVTTRVVFVEKSTE